MKIFKHNKNNLPIIHVTKTVNGLLVSSIEYNDHAKIQDTNSIMTALDNLFHYSFFVHIENISISKATLNSYSVKRVNGCKSIYIDVKYER
jgi:hypothetical protein